MAKRSTIKVNDVVQRVNRMLSVGDKISQDAKQILCSLAEEVLMDTGNYKGFACLAKGEEYDRVYFTPRD